TSEKPSRGLLRTRRNDLSITHQNCFSFLMLLLKRFKFDYYYMHYYKVEHRVELPLILEIQNQTYELYAFVEHHGYLKYGNYTANIKSPEDMEWYHFNDDRVNVRIVQCFYLQIMFYTETLFIAKISTLFCSFTISSSNWIKLRRKFPCLYFTPHNP
uniref:USP domain-containing protein n=1 Tax=Oryzias melastigma TaxID=30732 RepID=A0A3B3C5A8_ORYME